MTRAQLDAMQAAALKLLREYINRAAAQHIRAMTAPPTDLKPDQRLDWSRVFTDLVVHGYTIESIQQITGIPKSTLLGYRNQAAEPKHADGERVLAIWRRCMLPPLPIITDSIRQTHRVTKR